MVTKAFWHKHHVQTPTLRPGKNLYHDQDHCEMLFYEDTFGKSIRSWPNPPSAFRKFLILTKSRQ